MVQEVEAADPRKTGQQNNGRGFLLGDGRPIGYVLAPVGDQYRCGRGRRQLPRRPVGQLRVTILDEMTEGELEDWSD